MKTSVLIIAHNEEKYLARCIESILNQSEKPDEIILLLHNTTDSSQSIALTYPIKTILLEGETGIVHARIEGLRHVVGDIVCCIDGDSFAKRNWVFEMKKALLRGNVLVGSLVNFTGTLFGWVANFFNKRRFKKVGDEAAGLIWGPSFACWKKDIPFIIEIYEKSIALSKDLGLTRNPEDYWLALFMSKRGGLEVINTTLVVNNVKEETSIENAERSRENVENGKRILQYFRENC